MLDRALSQSSCLLVMGVKTQKPVKHVGKSRLTRSGKGSGRKSNPILKRPSAAVSLHDKENKPFAKSLIVQQLKDNVVPRDILEDGSAGACSSFVYRVSAEMESLNILRKHRNFKISEAHMLQSYDEGFVLTMICRQISTVAKRLGVKVDIPWASRQITFSRSVSIVIKDLVEQHDFEEPIPDNSPWLARQKRIISAMVPESTPYDLFLARMVVFHTGSEAFLDLVEENLEDVRRRLTETAKCTKHELIHILPVQALACNVFHDRYRPMLIYWNACNSGAPEQAAQAALTHADDDLECDDVAPCAAKECASPEIGKEIAVWRTTFLLHKALPSRKQVDKAWDKFQRADDEQAQLEALVGLKGFGGLGYTRKNFSLFLFDEVERAQVQSPGGIGPRQSYAISAGSMRKDGEGMTPEALSWMVRMDMNRLFAKFWNGRFFPKIIWDNMRPAEREPCEVAVTSMRCAFDKVGWKVFFGLHPPDDFATWRDYSRHLRYSRGQHVRKNVRARASKAR